MKKLIVSVLTVALIAGFFSSSTAHPQTAEAAISNWHKGISINSRYAEDFASEDFKQSVRNAKDSGVNYVALVLPYRQTNLFTTDITPAWSAPSNTTLISAVDFIHSQGMSVMFKPHLESDTQEWRAGISPGGADRATWYRNYSAMLNNLGTLAQAHGVEEISIGTELINMATFTSNPDNTQQWVTMINSLRGIYSGKLTYGANWGDEGDVREVDHIGFWPQLDYIGISAYYPLNGDPSSVDSLAGEWTRWERERIKPLYDQYHKPILFTEVGYKSTYGAANAPYAHWNNNGYFAEGQVALYGALFKYWDTKDYMAGVMLWDWSSNPGYGGEGNQDYTPQNKPAQNIMKQWFGSSSTSTTTPPTSTSTNPNPNPNPTTPSSFNGNASVEASASSPRINQELTIPVTVRTSGQATNVINDIEIYDASGSKVFQKYFENQTYSSTQPAQHSIVWTPTATGEYALKTGIFSRDWTTNYFWGNEILKFTVTNGTNPNPNPTPTTTPPTGTSTNPNPDPDPQPAPTSGETNIWWPGNGVSVQGVQPFKAMLEGNDVGAYSMYWQVDGDQLNEMFNSTQDYPHKEALVDLSGWNWRENGWYNINFVSRDTSGKTLSEKSIDIKVTH